jgi:hypothetical protein
MSSSEDEGEIKLNHSVYNADYINSDDSDDDSDLESVEFSRERLKSVDENTEDNAKVLGELLAEVATVDAMGRNVIRVELFNPKVKFLKKNEDIEFDQNEHGYPFVPCECEEYLLPFLHQLRELRKELRGTKIETNSKGIEYKF